MRLKLNRTDSVILQLQRDRLFKKRMKFKITELSSSISLNILKYVLLLLLADTVISNCSNFEWTDNNQNNYIWSIVGEWRVVDCRVNNENVTAKLWFKRNKKIDVDGDLIKLVSKNVFNITNLQLGDKGKYYCEACGNTKPPLRINVKKGTPFAKPEITNQPQIPVKYESNFKLECSLNGSYFDYEMLWFKVQANGNEIQVKSTTQSIWSLDYDKIVQREILEITNFTQVNEGKYFCRVKRHAVNYVRKAFIELHLEELSKPVLSNFPSDGKVFGNEKRDFVVNHYVSGTPAPDLAWFKSVNGKQESTPICECSGKTKTCSPTKNNNIEITMESFVIKNLTYLQHQNVTYICKAKNIKGFDERNITMFVKTKPRLTAALQSRIQILKENLRLDCTLSKDVNPKNMSYSWAFCDKKVYIEENDVAQQSCQNEEQWKPIKRRENNIIVFKNQTGGIRLYRCIAENEISKDNLKWTIVRPADDSKSECGINVKRVVSHVSQNKEENSSRIKPIVIWQSIVAFLAILLLVTLFLTFHRRNPRKQDHTSHVLPASSKKIMDHYLYHNC